MRRMTVAPFKEKGLWQVVTVPMQSTSDLTLFTTKRDARAFYDGKLDLPDCEIVKHVKRHLLHGWHEIPVLKSTG